MTWDKKMLSLLLAFIAGLAIGSFYFLSLWLTVRHLPTAGHPALLALGSFWGRFVVAMISFYYVMGGNWERLTVCLLGFLGIRSILIRYLRPITQVR